MSHSLSMTGVEEGMDGELRGVVIHKGNITGESRVKSHKYVV